MYKLPIGVGKRLDSLMRCFLWKGYGSGQRCGQALVSWDNVYRPNQAGGLGIINIHKMNTTFQPKWVARFLSSREDLITQVLKESYGRELNGDRYAAPFQGASPFWQGLRHIFWRMLVFFAVQLGDISAFQY